MNVAVLLAGGTGQRLGADKPKQFVDICGKPAIVYALEIYEKSQYVDVIEVVCVKDYIDYMWDLAKKYNISKLKYVCEGGCSCQESTMKGIFYLEGKVDESDLLMFNMSTSLFVTDEIIKDSLETATKYGSAFACLQCIYNNAETEDGISSTKINFKEKNRTLNLPWTSSFGKLDKLYRTAEEKNIEMGQASYMPTLFLAMGEPLYFSLDTSLNKIHITREEDVEIVRAIIEYRQRR